MPETNCPPDPENHTPDAPQAEVRTPSDARPKSRRRKADGRTRAARRIKIAATRLREELAGHGHRLLSHSEQAMVADAAALIVRSEELQDAMAQGKAVDADTLVRLSGAKQRALEALGLIGDGLERRKQAEAEANRKRLLDQQFPNRTWDR